MNIDQAYRRIEANFGFDDPTTMVGEAWDLVKEQIATLQSQLAASQERERILREGLEEIISLDDDDSRWPSEVTDYEQGVISGIEEAADIARDTFKAAEEVK